MPRGARKYIQKKKDTSLDKLANRIYSDVIDCGLAPSASLSYDPPRVCVFISWQDSSPTLPQPEESCSISVTEQDALATFDELIYTFIRLVV